MPRVRRGRACPRRPIGALLLGLVVAILAAAPASAAELTRTDDALPGSSFQGGDGNQDDAPALIDWQALQATGVVHHSPDPQGAAPPVNDDAIDGQELNPGGWKITESGGNSPPKANIRDAWSALDQPDGNTFLYLGFTRAASGGTTYLAFELNTDARRWDNDDNPDTPRIPCRRTGDVLVAFEPHGNDPDVDVVIQRWRTGDGDPDTVDTDLKTGCARNGTLSEYTRFEPNVDAQGATNPAVPQTLSRLPGDAFPPGEDIPVGRFGEAALNLAKLLEEGFGDHCLAFRSVWMHSRSSTSGNSSMQDYVAPRRLHISTCSASGTKFFDRNANGVRDLPEDIGIPRFLIFADYNENGLLDRREPRAVTDDGGQYVLHDIRPPEGTTYQLREKLLGRHSRTAPVALDWMCSYPNDDTGGGTGSAPNGRFPCAWGPIDVSTSPNVTGLNFGNWFPARLTLRKQIEPANDLGLFNLFVGNDLVLANAGDDDSITIGLPPGIYDISEGAAGETIASDYESSVRCRRKPSRRGNLRPGTIWEDLPLSAGDRATCTFFNIRPGVPAIAILKIGPELAMAGDTLRYTFEVSNPGDVAFPESGVEVDDPDCDDPPTLEEKQGGSGADDSIETLDPGDTWVYSCSNSTDDPGNACEPSRVDNTGTVTGSVNGGSFPADDSVSTVFLCPDRPTPPPPEPLDPPGPDGEDQPGPVVPPGPRPPNAGDAAKASFLFRQATAGCITDRVPRVNFSGTNIRRVRIYVNGQLRRGLTVRTLQRRVTPRVTLAPGRYRLAARVTFQRGAGTPPVTFSRVIRICAAAQPRFTG